MANAKLVEAISGFTTEVPGFPTTIAAGEILDAGDMLVKANPDGFREVRVRAETVKYEPPEDDEDDDAVDSADVLSRKAQDEADAVEDPADLPGAPDGTDEPDDVGVPADVEDAEDEVEDDGEVEAAEARPGHKRTGRKSTKRKG